MTLDMHFRNDSLRNNCERSRHHAESAYVRPARQMPDPAAEPRRIPHRTTALDLPPNVRPTPSRTMLRRDDPADACGAGKRYSLLSSVLVGSEVFRGRAGNAVSGCV